MFAIMVKEGNGYNLVVLQNPVILKVSLIIIVLEAVQASVVPLTNDLKFLRSQRSTQALREVRPPIITEPEAAQDTWLLTADVTDTVTSVPVVTVPA